LEVKRSNHAIDFKIERIKVDVTFQNTMRDTMMEEKRDREQRERYDNLSNGKPYIKESSMRLYF